MTALISVLILLFGIQASAQEVRGAARSKPAAPTGSEKSPFDQPVKDVLKVAASKPGKLHRKCSSFIAEDGTYGKNAEAIATELESDADLKWLLSKQAADTDLKTVCPGFQRMNKEQRKAFWVWTVAGLANKETNCGASKPMSDPKVSGRKMMIYEKKPDGKHQATGQYLASKVENKVPEGILQLPVRDSRKFYGKQCDKDLTEEQQGICALKMLRYNMVSGGAKLFNKNSWWNGFDVGARPGSMKPHLNNFPLCSN